MGKKIVIIMPDGIGLKNFGFSKIPYLLQRNDIELQYWNSTPFDLSKLGLASIKFSKNIPFKADLLKRAKIEIELDIFNERFKNDVYQTYKFPKRANTLKAYIKNLIVNFYKFKYKNRAELIQAKINQSIINSKEYESALTHLKREEPDLLFCTNQRASNAMAPVLAAKALNIPTACFIFSWDNLPKATKIIDADFYFVWSNYMKKELLKYYPYIQENQIKVVGTPQFETHFKIKNIDLKTFKTTYDISDDKTYILFSGDDITTSPKDEQYLETVCKSVKELNKKHNKNINILFRRCPVDFSNRYNPVLKKYKSLVTEVKPLWQKQGQIWNTISPTREDAILQACTINICQLVVNLGSSMVFDAVCHHKPTAFINFNPVGIDIKDWSVKKIYNYIHFQSMPSKDGVIWLNSKEEIPDKILEGLDNPDKYVKNAQKWFEIINQHPPQNASERIVAAINNIIQ